MNIIYIYKQFCFIYEEFIIKLLNLLKFIKYKSTENVYIKNLCETQTIITINY